jgi:hypothetical protein
MEALRKKSGNRPRWHDTKTGFENLLKNYKKRLDELNFSCITNVEIGETINKNMKTNPITTLIKSAVFAVAFAGVAQAATSTYTDSETITTAGTSFTFTQFDTSLGTLSAVDLILNSSVPGGYLAFTKSGGGSATYTGLLAGIDITDSSFNTLFTSGTSLSLTATPAAGNGTFSTGSAANTKQFNISGSQSLLSSTPTTQSVSAPNWTLFTGAGSFTLDSNINALASYTSTGGTVTPDYTNLNALTSISVRYTYTAAPSGVPEPRQAAASLLVLVGVGGYAFMKRKKTPVAV